MVCIHAVINRIWSGSADHLDVLDLITPGLRCYAGLCVMLGWGAAGDGGFGGGYWAPARPSGSGTATRARRSSAGSFIFSLRSLGRAKHQPLMSATVAVYRAEPG